MSTTKFNFPRIVQLVPRPNHAAGNESVGAMIPVNSFSTLHHEKNEELDEMAEELDQLISSPPRRPTCLREVDDDNWVEKWMAE